jgi:DNA helicase IV
MVTSSIEFEQQRLDAFHADLARHIDHLRRRIDQVASAPATGTGQDDLEREAHLVNLRQQLRSAEASQSRLCFGRIDPHDQTELHVGRIGLRSAAGGVILVDWRAPQAAPFYQATSAQPMGLALRRRIATRQEALREVVTHIDDEHFDGETDYLPGAEAMSDPRSGRMGDILATIAANQDAIIRSPLECVTVVQGGPGTGKTVVALHRAAWLLYTYRERLGHDGVLVIGPTSLFLRYIDQVLPSLGESDVVLLTPATLVPGICASSDDPPHVAAIKGDLRMSEVIARAISDRVRIPVSDVRIVTESHGEIRIRATQLADAMRGLSRVLRYHEGRETFLRRVLEAAARNRLRDAGDTSPSADEVLEEVADFIDDRHVRRTLNLMWMPIDSPGLVDRLLSDADYLGVCANGILDPREQRLLLRSPGSPWTSDDIPLIDEVAARVGHRERPRQSPRPSHPDEPRELDARELHVANAMHVDRSNRTVAERAFDDRMWIYGHVIVDEAQELSAMAWRAVQRRASRKSMTVVGDLQQASHPAAARTWEEALGWAGDAVRLHELTITYRITAEIADTARSWLTAYGGNAPTLRPIRSGSPTIALTREVADVRTYIEKVLIDFVGRAAVIVPASDLPRWTSVLHGDPFGFGSEAIDAIAAVITAQHSKGLEFDHVFIISPQDIAQEAPDGANIYVACTRATTQLHLITLA